MHIVVYNAARVGRVSTIRKCEWNIPYRCNLFFTGREDILVHLHDALHENEAQYLPVALSQPQALSGLGGIGKTQTTIEYAYRYRDEYIRAKME